MWNEITSDDDLKKFMDDIGHFHDGCIKEMKYLSGAYVGDNLGMYPLNDRRILNVIIQRQFKENSMIELEFSGLKFLRLFPTGEEYTCEILDSMMFFKDDYIYWCDCEDVSEEELEEYEGTLICAEKLRWRSIYGCMGEKEFYKSVN